MGGAHPTPKHLQHRCRCRASLRCHTYCDRLTLYSAWQALILKELRGVPNVVQLLGYDDRARQLYLPRLQPLANYLEHRFRRVPAKHKSLLLRKVIRDVLRGVAELHEHRVCHRDLKIDNVLIVGSLPGPCGSWKPSMMSAQLCDFGYSLMAGVNEDVDEARRLNPGTPPYIAPEVYDARQAAMALDRGEWQRADVYSAGMMVWGLCRAKTTCFFPSVDGLNLKPDNKERKLGQLIMQGGRPSRDP